MTTPTSAAQPDSAPPSDAEVEAALGELCGFNEGDSAHADLIRARIAALRSENAALRSEQAALTAERDEAKKQAEIAVNSQRTICRAAERLTAERDALRGRLLRLAARWEEYADTLRGGPEAREVEGCAGELRREIARLESLLAGEGEGAK